MDNSFVGLKQTSEVDPIWDQDGWRLSEIDHKQMREALYAEYTPMVYNILDQLISAYWPGIWKKDSDYNHAYCCHCRWYAGPEETHRTQYDDHAIRRRLEIELEVDDQYHPTGFKILSHRSPGKCVCAGLSHDELVRGIKVVLY